MDDEFIQEIFSKELSKFPTRHYIVLLNVGEEKRRRLENTYNVRVISYQAVTNEDHIKELRKILKDIQSNDTMTVLDHIRLNQLSTLGGLHTIDNLSEISTSINLSSDHSDYLKLKIKK